MPLALKSSAYGHRWVSKASMRIQTTFPAEMVDLTPLTKLVFPLLGQWDSLTFAADGSLLSGKTGEAIPHLRLIDGQHKKAGSTYAFVDQESDQDQPDTPPQLHVKLATLKHDDRHKIEVSVVPEKAHPSRVSANVELEKRAWPRGEITATVGHTDLPSYSLVRFSIGSETKFSFSFDTAALQVGGGGQFAHGMWRAGRFGGKGLIELQQTSEEWWEVTVSTSLSGRGIFRPLVFIFSPLLRRLAQTLIADMQAGYTGEFPNLRLDLADIAAATASDADARLFVHRLVWDDGNAEALLFPRSSVIDEDKHAALRKQLDDIAPTPP